jgi:hypothetical protein
VSLHTPARTSRIVPDPGGARFLASDAWLRPRRRAARDGRGRVPVRGVTTTTTSASVGWFS